MYPVLFRIGTYDVPSYGTALFLAFAVGIAVAYGRAPSEGLDRERVLDVCILVLVTSILGSRLLWVVTHLDRFRPPTGTWTDAFNPFQSTSHVGIIGLSMLGGVVLAILSTLLFLVTQRLPVLRTTDLLAPSAALGEGITRIGCFLNGCCHGRICELAWGVRFPEGSSAALLFPDTAVHPTQLYASLVGFATFGLLLWFARRKPFAGAVSFTFLVVSGAARIGLDFVRHYEEEVILFRAAGTAFTINQALALGLALAGAAGLVVVGRRGAPAPQRAP